MVGCSDPLRYGSCQNQSEQRVCGLSPGVNRSADTHLSDLVHDTPRSESSSHTPYVESGFPTPSIEIGFLNG